jgi:hypothetical protein
MTHKWSKQWLVNISPNKTCTISCDPMNKSSIVFICLGRQTKQIMVAKFQTLLLLIANAERSPLF